MKKICILTGQPGAGKTTIANEIAKASKDEWFIIDGDDIRELFDNKDYSKDGRIKNITLAHNIAKYLLKNDKNVIVSLVSPYRELRNSLKDNGGEILEVFVYTNEIRGKEKYFAEDYEEPTDDFLEMCTDIKTSRQCAYDVLIEFQKKYEKDSN